MFRRRDLVVATFAFMLGSSSVVFAAGQLGLIGSDGVIHGCVNTAGLLRVIDASDECRASETPLSWSQSGAQGPTGPTGATGPAGTFSGTFTSPNGQYAISVTDTGIVLSGVGTNRVTIDSSGITVLGTSVLIRSDVNTRIDTGANLTLNTSSNTTIRSGGAANYESAGPTTIKGSVVNIN